MTKLLAVLQIVHPHHSLQHHYQLIWQILLESIITPTLIN